jgi:hypothetical protein
MPRTILNVAKVIKVIDLHTNGVSIKQIASTCGVTYEQARRIVNGKCWAKKIQRYKDQLTQDTGYVEDVQ